MSVLVRLNFLFSGDWLLCSDLLNSSDLFHRLQDGIIEIDLLYLLSKMGDLLFLNIILLVLSSILDENFKLVYTFDSSGFILLTFTFYVFCYIDHTKVNTMFNIYIHPSPIYTYRHTHTYIYTCERRRD